MRINLIGIARAAALGSALGAVGIASARAQPEATPPQPSAAQPTLPQPFPGGSLGSSSLGGGSPKVGSTSGSSAKPAAKPLVVRRHRARHIHRYASAERIYGPVERPALAGVQVFVPLPHPPQPPHLVVPTPAYPLENLTVFFTTPAPPLVCHRAPRDPDVPDPHLYRERTAVCEADNP